MTAVWERAGVPMAVAVGRETSSSTFWERGSSLDQLWEEVAAAAREVWASMEAATVARVVSRLAKTAVVAVAGSEAVVRVGL